MLMQTKTNLRAQSRGDSGFARVLTMLAMLFIAATGAWAQETSWTNIVINSDMEGDDVSCFYVKENAKGAENMFIARITDGIGKEIAGNPSRAIKVLSTGTEVQTWDTQFFIRLPYELPKGTPYRLSFDYKANNNADADFQCANEPGEYIIWYIGENDYDDFSFTTSWQTFSRDYTVPDVCNGQKHSETENWLDNFQTIYFSLALNKVATEFIIDNVKVEIPSDVLNTLTPSPVTDPTLMIPYYDEDDVAVGKLEAAIETYDDIASPTADDKNTLKAAIDQFKADNADQEKDETAKVATDGWKKFNGEAAGVCDVQYAPAIDTYDGRKNVNLAECFEWDGNRTGTIIYQDITGLTNGQYKVGFYGNAFSTTQRDHFECIMEDGATDAAYVFANEKQQFITARLATSTTENNFRQFDVEVTDGTIKLGMGKAYGKSTNWHTMQIYQLTWFTTAKQAYAASQTELKALLTEARTLLADENKIEGKNDFNTAIANAEPAVDSKMINNTEIEAIIADLKTAIANFKKANWFIDFSAGQYYLIDVESTKMMAAGHEWGSHGIVNELGLDLTLTPNSETRTVTIDSRVFNNATDHFLGSNLYMDSPAYGWAFEYQGFGFYILNPASEKYLNIDANDNLVLSDTPREWIIVTAEGVMEQLLADMANATEENPVDATRLIKANSFNRNDARNAEAWTVEQTLTGEGHTTTLSGGEDYNDGSVGNNCAEAYGTPFSFTQTITGAPAGVYQLTAQGFYVEEEGEDDAPTFFANGAKGAIPARTGNEGDMKSAAISFKAGNYTNNPIEFQVKDNGQIVLGVSGTSERQWVIFDNFRLTYLGAAPVVTTQKVSLAEGTEDADNWKVKAGDATEFGDLPVEGVPEGTTVTLKYNGTKRVKSVKAVVTGGAAAAPAVKPAATLTEAPKPWDEYYVGDELLETLGTAGGGTLMYKLTTTNEKPTSTEGFSTENPKGVENAPSYKNYIWYYIKGDDTHSDSEIFGPIELDVWDS